MVVADDGAARHHVIKDLDGVPVQVLVRSCFEVGHGHAHAFARMFRASDEWSQRLPLDHAALIFHLRLIEHLQRRFHVHFESSSRDKKIFPVPVRTLPHVTLGVKSAADDEHERRPMAMFHAILRRAITAHCT